MTYRPNPKRGRTALVLMGALIMAAEIAGGFLIDHAPLKIRFPQVAGVIDSLQQLKPSKKILFFGSSRFGNDVSAEAATQVLNESKVGDGISVFNAYISAGDPLVIEFLNDKLLAANIHPWIAVIEILPEVLSPRILWLHFHFGRQFRWLDVWNSLPEAYLAGKLPEAIATRFNSFYLFRSEFQRWAIDALKLRFESSNFADANTRKRRQANRAEPADAATLQAGATAGRKNVRDYEIGGLNTRALERMIQRFRKLGTTVVLIAPPVSSPYRTAYKPQINTAYLAYIQRLAEKYGTTFYDYRHRLSDHYFYGPYYATTDGKDYFSRLLAREVLVPSIAGARVAKPSGAAPSPGIPAKPGIEVRNAPDGGPPRGG